MSNLIKSSKSQVFMLDVLFSFVIIIVSLALIFNYYMSTTENIDIHDLNKNILNGFSNTKINDLNGEEIREMFIQNKITNIHNTVAQQVAEFYYMSENSYAENLTEIFAKDYLDKQMNFVFTLENDTDLLLELYEIKNRPEIDYENASITSVSQRKIFAFKNNTDFYGPYNFKIKIWK